MKKLRLNNEQKLKTEPKKLKSLTGGLILWTQPKKLRLPEAVFDDLSQKKPSDHEKTLKTEAQKLRLPEGLAYRVLQKSVKKGA